MPSMLRGIGPLVLAHWPLVEAAMVLVEPRTEKAVAASKTLETVLQPEGRRCCEFNTTEDWRAKVRALAANVDMLRGSLFFCRLGKISTKKSLIITTDGVTEAFPGIKEAITMSVLRCYNIQAAMAGPRAPDALTVFRLPDTDALIVRVALYLAALLDRAYAIADVYFAAKKASEALDAAEPDSPPHAMPSTKVSESRSADCGM